MNAQNAGEDKPLLVPRVRHRNSVSDIRGANWFGGGKSPFVNHYQRTVLQSTQVTRDRKNLWPFVQSRLRAGGAQAGSVSGLKMLDLGHSFFSEHLYRSTSLVNFFDDYYARGINQSWGVRHEGPVFIAGAVSPFQPWSKTEVENDQAIAFGLGATAINRARPNKPIVDLATTIGEMRSEGIPSMFGSILARSNTLRNLAANGGKEYLNAQFGWAPLMRDVTSLAKQVLHTRKILEQYHRDLSREVRRRYSFPDQVDTSLTEHPISTDSQWWVQGVTPLGGLSNRYQTFANPFSRGTLVTKNRTSTWFSGAFRYLNATAEHDFGTLAAFEEDANVLLGTRLDPEVLWNLQPWTWMVDWFINYGDILGNFSSFVADHQVMHYGYIMRTSHSSVEYSVPGIYRKTGSFGTDLVQVRGPFHSTVTSIRKSRGAASPFGFGLSPDGFTPSQWAILGALGTSRLL